VNFFKKLFSARPANELSDKDLGARGERAAAVYLEKHGYTVLERNWRCRIGEIDLVCRVEDRVAFIEVKTSRKRSDWAPELRVGAAKQRKLHALAKHYLKYKRIEAACQFDIVAVWWEENEIQIRHYANAFVGR
jgi:putative endonuclease